MKNTKTLFAVLLSLLLLPFVVSCGGSSSTSTGQTGTLALKLIDAPGDFQAVYITIKEVQVHKSGDDDNVSTEENSSIATDQNSSAEAGWITVVEGQKTYDLLELQNGVEAVLGEENLSVGYYTQMRLILDTNPDESNNTLDEVHPFANYVIVDGNYFEITIPSGLQTGIKLIKGFQIEANTTTTLTLDFDANKSIFLTGNGAYKMKPTITIIQE